MKGRFLFGACWCSFGAAIALTSLYEDSWQAWCRYCKGQFKDRKRLKQGLILRPCRCSPVRLILHMLLSRLFMHCSCQDKMHGPAASESDNGVVYGDRYSNRRGKLQVMDRVWFISADGYIITNNHVMKMREHWMKLNDNRILHCWGCWSWSKHRYCAY